MSVIFSPSLSYLDKPLIDFPLEKQFDHSYPVMLHNVAQKRNITVFMILHTVHLYNLIDQLTAFGICDLDILRPHTALIGKRSNTGYRLQLVGILTFKILSFLQWNSPTIPLILYPVFCHFIIERMFCQFGLHFQFL